MNAVLGFVAHSMSSGQENTLWMDGVEEYLEQKSMEFHTNFSRLHRIHNTQHTLHQYYTFIGHMYVIYYTLAE